MRINEKNLTAFAVSATPVDREGHLGMKNEASRSFQKRYFLLKGNLLFYFERKGDKEPVGVIILEGCTIELAEDDELYSFKIAFHGTAHRSCYVLGSESQESLEAWMKALACAGYDYMKLMVAELQRQLADIEEAPNALAAAVVGSPVPPPRNRHNPFNKLESANHHQRSQSMRAAAGRGEEAQRIVNGVDGSSSSKAATSSTMTFWELHNIYARPILTDYNAWKHLKRKRDENLIAL